MCVCVCLTLNYYGKPVITVYILGLLGQNLRVIFYICHSPVQVMIGETKLFKALN